MVSFIHYLQIFINFLYSKFTIINKTKRKRTIHSDKLSIKEFIFFFYFSPWNNDLPKQNVVYSRVSWKETLVFVFNSFFFGWIFSTILETILLEVCLEWLRTIESRENRRNEKFKYTINIFFFLFQCLWLKC